MSYQGKGRALVLPWIMGRKQDVLSELFFTPEEHFHDYKKPAAMSLVLYKRLLEEDPEKAQEFFEFIVD